VPKQSIPGAWISPSTRGESSTAASAGTDTRTSDVRTGKHAWNVGTWIISLLLILGWVVQAEPVHARERPMLPQYWQPTGAQHVAPGRSPETNYLLRCSGCHGLDGTGTKAGGIPPFPGFIDVFFRDDESRLYLAHVPGLASANLTDAEIADVMNYVLERWGAATATHDVTPFSAEEITRLRATSVPDVVQLRRQITERLASSGVALPEYPWP